MTTKTKSLTERWFTEVLGWKKEKLNPFSPCNTERWQAPNYSVYEKLPNLTDEIMGLGLQNKWVLPELKKRYSKFTIEKSYSLNIHILVTINLYSSVLAEATELAEHEELAQLKAALKAVGKEIKNGN